MTNENKKEDVVKFYVLKIKEYIHYDYDYYEIVGTILKDHQPISLPSEQYSEFCALIMKLNSQRHLKSKKNQYAYQVIHVIDEEEYKYGSLFEEILALQEEIQKQEELEKIKREREKIKSEQAAAKKAINKEKQLQKQIEKARLDLEKLQQRKAKGSK